MNAPSPIALASAWRTEADPGSPALLLLGRAARMPGGDSSGDRSGDWPCRFVLDPEQAFDAMVILDAAAAAQAEALLRLRRAWLLPVADLSGTLWFADIGGRATTTISLRDAIDGLLRILARLQALPDEVTEADDPETILLIRAYSRGGRLQPVYDGNCPQLVRLPAAGLLDAPAAVAERLTEGGWFKRSFFDRLHVCVGCGSSRLNVREECPACRSADVCEETLMHHFRCAHQASERQFRDGDGLRCPKCGRQLRHFGVDYDRPGLVTACRRCGHMDADAAVGFVCIDCGRKHDGDGPLTCDWHAYALTEMGERRLLGADLRMLNTAGSGKTEAFHALARHWMRIQSRYGRPATILRLAFTRFEQAQQEFGSRRAAQAKRQAVEIVRGELRDTDFMIEVAEGMLIVLPETGPDAVDIPRRRLLDRLAATLALDLGIDVRAIDPAELLPPDDDRR